MENKSDIELNNCKSCKKYDTCTKKEENETAILKVKDLAQHNYSCFQKNTIQKEDGPPDKQITSNDVLSNKQQTDFVVKCDCGCDNTIRITKEMGDINIKFLSDFYKIASQNNVINVIKQKLKKIKAILKNQDYAYFDIMMTDEQFHDFRKYIDNMDDSEGENIL